MTGTAGEGGGLGNFRQILSTVTSSPVASSSYWPSVDFDSKYCEKLVAGVVIGVAGLIVDGEWLAVGVKLAECDGVLDNDDAAANREEALSERSRSSRTYASRSTDSAALPRPDGGLMFGDGGEGDREM